MNLFLREDLSVQLTEGGAICLDLRTGNYFRCNESMAEVLLFIRDEKSYKIDISDIAGHLKDTFGIASATALSDANAIVTDLRNIGLAHD